MTSSPSHGSRHHPLALLLSSCALIVVVLALTLTNAWGDDEEGLAVYDINSGRQEERRRRRADAPSSSSSSSSNNNGSGRNIDITKRMRNMVGGYTGPLDSISLTTDAGVIEAANFALSEFARLVATPPSSTSSSHEDVAMMSSSFPTLVASITGGKIDGVRVVVLEARRQVSVCVWLKK